MHITIDGHEFTADKVEIIIIMLIILVLVVFLIDWRKRRTCNPNIITVEELERIQKEYLSYTEKDSRELNTKLLKAVYGSACK